ncbi:helix-turn-helix domain-containing protein [uncultured Nitratireductor sp.]|uniref:helix-turn-helix domain-containing protein n=1 Tax=uncultured Nitratireductor sp. TaxID=520953 RepID=UPI0025CDE096|nr:helix-turn-helix domain-containing protein [uncultured Nitratireductor sp.]
MEFERARSSFRALSTRSQSPRQRFDFWRSLFPRIELDPVEEDSRRDFEGHVLHYAAQDGTAFVFCTNDDTRARFGQSEGNFVMLSLTLAGSAKVQHGFDTRFIFRPSSGLLALDGGQQSTTVSRDHSVISLMLPRDKIVAALGNDLTVLREGPVSLPHRGMTHLLTSHLHTMAMEGERLDRRSADIAMKAATDMALATLAQVDNREDGQQVPGHDAAVLAAARRYIQLQCGDHKLTAAGIARAVGCSRAYLYQAFAVEELSVGDTLRAARLERAAALLLAFADMPVKLVAFRSGYADAAAFARAFRTHRGMSPREYREFCQC